MTKKDDIFNKIRKNQKPTETFMHGNTKVNIYGKLDMKRLAEVVYKLMIKYDLK